MLRTAAIRVNKVCRPAINAKRAVLSAGRCSSSVFAVNEQSPASTCHNFPNISPCNVMQHRFFFTTAKAYGELKTFPCPGLPESISDGGLTQMKKVGESIAVDETVCEIETQKTALPVRSDVAGILKEWLVEDGGTVTPGMELFVVEVGAEAAAGAPAPKPAAEAAAPPPPPPPAASPATPPPTPSPPSTPVSTEFPPLKPMSATPAPKAAPLPPPIAVQPIDSTEKPEGPTRTERRVKMTRMRQTIANRLKDAQNTYAMLTTFNEVDMSAIFELRRQYKDDFVKKHGVKLGFMSPFIVGAASALREMPVINAVIDDKEIVYRDYVDISIAVATPRGLVVPVLRNADRFSLADAERTLADLGERARNNAISIEEMDGGTFTISNGGVFGSVFGTPIINPPQSAILGMHSIVDRPVVVRDPGAPKSAPGRIEARPIMYLALTYDHRIIDGREAVIFLRKVKSVVEDPRRLLLNLSV